MGKKRHASNEVSEGEGDARPGDARSPAPAGYARLLKDIKARIQQSRTRAIFSLNAEMIRLYWDIGRMIDERQQHEGWGAAVIPRLARELHNELPEEKGYSERNIKRMLAFYRAYGDPAAIVPQACGTIGRRPKSATGRGRIEIPSVPFAAPSPLRRPITKGRATPTKRLSSTGLYPEGRDGLR